jgi:hypothetical protein
MNNEPIGTQSSGGSLFYAQVLLMQTNRVAEKGSMPLKQDKLSEDAFRNSIWILDKMLKPYQDEEFEIEKARIMGMDEPKDSITTLEEFFEWFGALTCLMSRCGLMPMEEGTLYDTEADATDN